MSIAWTDQGDLLDLITDDPRVTPDYDKFIQACRLVAESHHGAVSINHVRMELSNSYGLTVEPRRYSGFWRKACRDGWLRWSGTYDTNDDLAGRNAGKPQRLYRWSA